VDADSIEKLERLRHCGAPFVELLPGIKMASHHEATVDEVAVEVELVSSAIPLLHRSIAATLQFVAMPKAN
jgi:hypothetical protein